MNVTQLSLTPREYGRANYIKTEVVSMARYGRVNAPNKQTKLLGFIDQVRAYMYEEFGEDLPATLPAGAAPVLDTATVAVVNSAGADSHNAIAAVAAGALTNVKLPATVAMADNGDSVAIQRSSGTAVGAAGTVVVANGVVTAVRPPATTALAVAGAQTGITVTGTYTSGVSFTIANGAITGITLS